MNKYRLMIVDSDSEHSNCVAGYLSGLEDFRVVGIASDGATALKMINSVRPDAILMDPLLPGIDGLYLMKVIQGLKNSPIIICISEAYTSVSIELARRNGASYYVYKPIEMKALADVLSQCCRISLQKQHLEKVRDEISSSGEQFGKIHSLLHEHGFSFKYRGSGYIAKSIEIAIEMPMALHNLSSGIYRKIADQSGISPESVERSMRTAIAHVNSDGSLTGKIGAVPTNKTCIQYLIKTLKSQL